MAIKGTGAIDGVILSEGKLKTRSVTQNRGTTVGVLCQIEILQGFWKEEGRSDREKETSKEILKKSDKLSIWQFCYLLPLCANPARESTSKEPAARRA